MVNYEEVTLKNVNNISEKLARSEGILLLCDLYNVSEFPSRECPLGLELNLFYNAEVSEHYQISVQLDLIRNRSFIIKPKTIARTKLKELWGKYKVLPIGDYELIVQQQNVVSRGLFPNEGPALYVPKDSTIESAVIHSLNRGKAILQIYRERRNFIEAPLKTENIENIVTAIMENVEQNLEQQRSA